jgi:CO/xanthine dehydrogenase FAD-binding subunit
MRYEAPTSVEEAVALLVAEPDSRVFAGATDLIPQLRAGRPEPSVVIDLKGIAPLTGVGRTDGLWAVGAATPTARITEEAGFGADFPGISEASGLIGSDQIQSRASLGGNLCNASPAADTIPALVVNDARVVIASPDGTREIPVADVTTGPGATSLAPHELVVEFRIDVPPPRTADAYLRFIPRTEMDIAVVGAAARITLDAEGTCTDAAIALGAVAPTVVRVPDAEAALVGETLGDEVLASVAAAASEACDPIDDKRGTADFRRRVAGVLAKRAVQRAWARADERGDGT